ncbi:MAG TPA: prepilin-type N-terminal cleavage/methylation domain-containing protein [Desulfatiglandales bacterium]|nr:prepilin-type N-terminal cleavage/methylation domain-containing protein [Desulfatiglandales bacterium]
MDYFKNSRYAGFTLLEIMFAVSIIAIAVVAVFGLQSQSLSMANEAKFNTTAALLAQSKMAEIETINIEDLASGSGDFGEDFPEYKWDLTVVGLTFAGIDEAKYLKQIDLRISYGQSGQYKYNLRLYHFTLGTE